ncbi:MAG TPA: hypothetical protein VH934_09995 [Xanthobacteraceae bacterium]|jgi:hypothetical protein
MVALAHLLGFRAAKPASQSLPAVTPPGVVAGDFESAAGAGHFSSRQIAALFGVLAAIASIPILLYPWAPLGDYINHLARMHVIATIDRDPDLALFYEIRWQVIPNLTMDLIVPTLERLMNVYLAGQIYTIMTFVLILSGTLALNRQLYGRWSVLPLIAFPLLYNFVFLVGTMNYLFGIGVALWALAAWAALRERALVVRLAVSTLFVFGLFFCHLYAVGVYGLGLLAFELWRLMTLWPGKRSPSEHAASRRLPPLLDFVASGLPFLPVLPLLLMSPTWTLRWDFTWELHGKIKGLLFAIEVYSHAATVFLAAVVAIAGALAIRHRALRFHPFGWLLLAVGGATYLVLPRVLFDTYMADQRLPIALAFMIIACTHLDLRDDFVRRGFATVLVLLLAVRALEVQSVWRELSRGTASFGESVRQIDRGSKVLVAYADPDSGDNARELWLLHAACLAIIERSALVTTAFTVLGKQVMHVRPYYRDRVDTEDGTPPSVKQLLQSAKQTDEDDPEDEPPYWSRWSQDYDYLYVLFTDPDYVNPDPLRLEPLYAGERFVLYRILRPQLARAAQSQATSASAHRFASAAVPRLGLLQRARLAAATQASRPPAVPTAKPAAVARLRPAVREPLLVRSAHMTRADRLLRLSVSSPSRKALRYSGRPRPVRRHGVRSASERGV